MWQSPHSISGVPVRCLAPTGLRAVRCAQNSQAAVRQGACCAALVGLEHAGVRCAPCLRCACEHAAASDTGGCINLSTKQLLQCTIMECTKPCTLCMQSLLSQRLSGSEREQQSNVHPGCSVHVSMQLCLTRVGVSGLQPSSSWTA